MGALSPLEQYGRSSTPCDRSVLASNLGPAQLKAPSWLRSFRGAQYVGRNCSTAQPLTRPAIALVHYAAGEVAAAQDQPRNHSMNDDVTVIDAERSEERRV